nr:MAG TPA: hypothetical protein [Caudoviricetes sp.]
MRVFLSLKSSPCKHRAFVAHTAGLALRGLFTSGEK